MKQESAFTQQCSFYCIGKSRKKSVILVGKYSSVAVHCSGVKGLYNVHTPLWFLRQILCMVVVVVM